MGQRRRRGTVPVPAEGRELSSNACIAGNELVEIGPVGLDRAPLLECDRAVDTGYGRGRRRRLRPRRARGQAPRDRFGPAAGPVLDEGDHLVDLERLGDEIVHAGGQGALPQLLEGPGGEGQDRQVLPARVRTQPAGRRIAVQARHLHVHQHDVHPVRMVRQPVQGLLTVTGLVDDGPVLFQNLLRHLPVDVIVIDHQHPHPGESRRLGRHR